MFTKIFSPKAPFTPFSAGTLLLPLRLVVGWTYFSAFWRRLVLENKLDPDAAGYIGEKFNHFLPNAFLIKPAIEYFVSHPELLFWKLVVFTLVEAVVGLALMLGLMTRMMGLLTAMLATGILFGAGWLGTTCLDEWQIGVLGLAAGMTFYFAGGGDYSLDRVITARFPGISGGRVMRLWTKISDAILPVSARSVVASGALILGVTLLTNQVFHGGVWGVLHNKSVKPLVELDETRLVGDALSVRLQRVEGADVYGSFAVEMTVRDATGAARIVWDAPALAALPESALKNDYVAKVKPGKRSLILPLGARARLTLNRPELGKLAPGEYTVELTDISGVSWSAPLSVR